LVSSASSFFSPKSTVSKGRALRVMHYIPASFMSLVHRVKLSLSNCMMRVESLHNMSARPLVPYQSNSLVRLFGEGIELGDSIVESLFGKVTSSVWAVEDLVAN
jgi:hypothetical protein